MWKQKYNSPTMLPASNLDEVEIQSEIKEHKISFISLLCILSPWEVDLWHLNNNSP